MDDVIYIYKSNGFYFGFIKNGFLFSRDGIYLAWVEGSFIWDAKGHFRGVLTNNKYIFAKRFAISPLSRTPKIAPTKESPPPPPPNIVPITLPPELIDAFNGNE